MNETQSARPLDSGSADPETTSVAIKLREPWRLEINNPHFAIVTIVQ